MKIIIPMAGTGDRFLRKGYLDPKPLICVNGLKIIEYICSMFDASDEIIFICNDIHLQTTNMSNILQTLRPKCKIYSIPSHKRGPVFTILNTPIEEYINNDEEIIICYCDNPYIWDYNHFKKYIKDHDSDGVILSHFGFHPHRLSNTFMAHMKTDDNYNVLEIKEKEPYNMENFSAEHASTGTYYFKKGSYIKKYFKMLIDKNLHFNNEFYVTLVYNLLINDGLKIHSYPTEFVTVFGTPEEVENFEIWQKLLNNESQIKNEDDLLKCYRYWKSYNEARNKYAAN